MATIHKPCWVSGLRHARQPTLSQAAWHPLFAGEPLGRPKKVTEADRKELKQLKAQRREEYLQRIPIDGKFGHVKNDYRINHNRAKRTVTSSALVNSIFLVMDLIRIFFVLFKNGVAVILVPLLRAV